MGSAPTGAHTNTMAPTSTAVPLLTLIILLISLSFTPLSSSTTTTSREASKEEAAPVPSPWPLQFHALLFMNHTGDLSMMDLWYDWIKGRNLNIIRDQLASNGPIYDVEWNNGTSFFYTLDDSRQCRRSQLDVGIPLPNWLDGAEYLGQQNIDGFLCNAWQKLNFIWYYEDVVTKQPVHWINSAGRAAHVMTFEVGAVFEDEKCQAPVYCFDKEERPEAIPSSVHFQGNLMLRSSLEDGMGLAM